MRSRRNRAWSTAEVSARLRIVQDDERRDGEGMREKIWRMIFEAETPSGRIFDITLLVLIAASVIVVCLETVESIESVYGTQLLIAEWTFTILFSIEYLLRLWVVRRPLKYAKSFFGVVDLLSCLPMYLSIFFPATRSLLVIRVLRLLRVFRILKMVRHVRGSQLLLRALYNSRAKITVFFACVVTFTVITGAVMYFVESGQGGGFRNIPESIYWAIVTISTVGFGDITPVTTLGKIITSICILIGYAIIAVPTGIISAELAAEQGSHTSEACPSCGAHGHLDDARYCRKCGEKLD